ncbi:stage III sporulation protein SpoAB [Siminovitchia terrae]|uniref:Stage III sporulation protein SpoAB n=1 Tax=Siminovitchia terrae TaxID=1914933 RepID=A0A429XD80_SIMTE|nr:stage III sporulation protein SpoIIIAB [Siminovitchia terrae]RST61415.1 stage III sporulation protein SpoAB [Siminovitchia terrae]GIN89584.1 stage III sporulation protein SpoAB [Siminovitchia terrae]GIN96391.1 stage III sporulation protein SpoAB [Siminovitchia terrae]
MFKLIGALLIIGTTTWAGFEASSHLTRRPKQLRIIKDSLQALDAEIMYSHTPLGEAAKKISSQMPEPAARLYKTFSEKLSKTDASVKSAWKESLDEVWQDTDMKTGEYEILMQFGESLGRHDRYTQQKQILLAVTHLDREEDEAREKQKKYEKIMKSLGVLSGLLFIILLF